MIVIFFLSAVALQPIFHVSGDHAVIGAVGRAQRVTA